MNTEIDKGVIFYRGHFSSRRFAHIYENDTFSSGKRGHFST